MNDQITITLTKDQAKELGQLERLAMDWVNRTHFLAQVADQQFGNERELSPAAWVGFGAVLEDVSRGIGTKTEFLSALTRQLLKETP